MADLARRQNSCRGDLFESLRDELLGPAGGEGEELVGRDRPTLRYLVGRLAPANTLVAAEEDEGTADAGSSDDDADTGYASPITMAMNPSSIGITFLTDVHVSELNVTLRWGQYEI